MIVTTQERTILRELASQVAEIAALPVQQETIALWKALNALKPVRPMVMIDQVCWHEMNVDDELTLRTESPFCRDLETHLRRTLYGWKHMRVDMVVEPVISIPKVIRNTGFGIEIVEREGGSSIPTTTSSGISIWTSSRPTRTCEKIRRPDAGARRSRRPPRRRGRARDLRRHARVCGCKGCCPCFAPWDVIAQWRGAQNVLFDLVDRPEFMHRIMSRLTDAYLAMLDQLEEQGLLGYGQATIHCSGAYTDELPAPGFDPHRPRARDLWTSGMAQIFSAVSPAMHQEFELDYAVRWYERFGLVYYGCCEPLHSKMEIIKRIPHVRKVSMSPWVDVDKGAERIGEDLVFSRKPNPAFLAGPTWDPRYRAAGPAGYAGAMRSPRLSRRVHPQGYQHGALSAAAAVGMGRRRHARREAIEKHTMNMAVRSKVGLAALCAAWFQQVGLQGEGSEAAKTLAGDYRRMVEFLGECFGQVVAPGIISTVSEAKRAAESFRAEQVDALLLVHIMWSEDQPLLALLDGCQHLPILLWNYHPLGFLPDKLTVNDLFRCSGTVGMLQGSAPLQRLGLTFQFFTGAPGDPALRAILAQYDVALRLRREFRGLRAGRVAGRCEVMTGTYVDEGTLQRSLGVTLVEISAHEYAEACAGVDGARVEAFYADQVARFPVLGVSEESLRLACRNTLALDDLVLRHNLGAVAIQNLGSRVAQVGGDSARACAHPSAPDAVWPMPWRAISTRRLGSWPACVRAGGLACIPRSLPLTRRPIRC